MTSRKLADRARSFRLVYPESSTAIAREGTKDRVAVDFRVSDASDTFALFFA